MDDILLNMIKGEAIKMDGVDVIGAGGAEFIPVIERNICYIVGGLVFNDNGEVLMTQEAKKSCYGKWYLPMGRLEPGENLVEGAIREVLEETGIETEPVTLLIAESAGAAWYRIIFILKQTGGELKRIEDRESIRADWFHPQTVLKREIKIRGSDILPVIEKGVEYLSQTDVEKPRILPIVNSHVQIKYCVVVTALTQEGDHAVLVNIDKDVRIPCCVVGRDDVSIDVSIFNLFKDAFGRSKPRPKVCGILSVEHCGKPSHKHDGICLTALVHIDTLPKLDGSNKDKYDWHVITNPDLIEKLQLMLKGKTIILLTDINSKV